MQCTSTVSTENDISSNAECASLKIVFDGKLSCFKVMNFVVVIVKQVLDKQTFSVELSDWESKSKFHIAI
jgi:hypothetical protein